MVKFLLIKCVDPLLFHVKQIASKHFLPLIKHYALRITNLDRAVDEADLHTKRLNRRPAHRGNGQKGRRRGDVCLFARG